jgi:esterase
MQLHFQSSGKGAPLIILHGLLGSLQNWQTVAGELAKSFQVLAVDQRNHGRSPHSAAMGYPEMAEDLREFLDRQGLTRARLLGHSMGGKTAMEFSLRFPDRVDKLLVVDIAPRAYPPGHRHILAALLSLNLAALRNRRQIEEALAGEIPDLAVRRFLLQNAAAGPDGSFHWRIDLPAISENYGRLCAALPEGRVCGQPALFLGGAQSDYLRTEDFALARSFFPQAQFRTIPGAGHWVHAEAPEAFVRAAFEFLN